MKCIKSGIGMFLVVVCGTIIATEINVSPGGSLQDAADEAGAGDRNIRAGMDTGGR